MEYGSLLGTGAIAALSSIAAGQRQKSNIDDDISFLGKNILALQTEIRKSNISKTKIDAVEESYLELKEHIDKKFKDVDKIILELTQTVINIQNVIYDQTGQPTRQLGYSIQKPKREVKSNPNYDELSDL